MESNGFTVDGWLEGLGMSQYAACFGANGYDTLRAVLTLNAEELHLLGVLRGHARVILEEVEILKVNSKRSREGKDDAKHTQQPAEHLDRPATPPPAFEKCTGPDAPYQPAAVQLDGLKVVPAREKQPAKEAQKDKNDKIGHGVKKPEPEESNTGPSQPQHAPKRRKQEPDLWDELQNRKENGLKGTFVKDEMYTPMEFLAREGLDSVSTPGNFCSDALERVNIARFKGSHNVKLEMVKRATTKGMRRFKALKGEHVTLYVDAMVAVLRARQKKAGGGVGAKQASMLQFLKGKEGEKQGQ